jgi:hypothetical protein
MDYIKGLQRLLQAFLRRSGMEGYSWECFLPAAWMPSM